MVKSLRDRMDLPMMECKSALKECDGDVEAAIEWLKKKYKGKMQERAGRDTGEGRVGVFIDELCSRYPDLGSKGLRRKKKEEAGK